MDTTTKFRNFLKYSLNVYTYNTLSVKLESVCISNYPGLNPGLT